jgi:hypothetical protein
MEMHWESNSVDSILEDDKRPVSMFVLRLRRRNGEDATGTSNSSLPPKISADVLQEVWI